MFEGSLVSSLLSMKRFSAVSPECLTCQCPPVAKHQSFVSADMWKQNHVHQSRCEKNIYFLLIYLYIKKIYI